jgi:hypothetical protein
MYNYISNLCSTQAEATLNHVNSNVNGTEQGEAMHRKCKRLKLGSNQAYSCLSD